MATWKEALEASSKKVVPAIAHHATLSVSLRSDEKYMVLTETRIVANHLDESQVEEVLRQHEVDPNSDWE